MKLLECVPNFSEGRNLDIIKQITDAIESVKGISLLDVDPGFDTNRTVVTLVGEPDQVVEAAFQGIKKASELIDMSTHSGAHARMGATDVCPFIPVSGLSEEDCILLAEKLGKRVGNELNIPVYLYEKAAKSPERENLATIRKGEYEALEEKLKKAEWKPDFGKAVFNKKSGATVIGVREFLIAYNVNLNTRDKKLATDIALTIREQGRNKRDKNNKFVRDEKGVIQKQPGLLRNCKAVGWFIDEYNCAQVSINLTDYNVTGIHDAFDTVESEALKRGLRVTGSEVVGLVPKKSLLLSGEHYLRKQGKSPGVPEEELIRIAIQSMGLSELGTFDPNDKIIDYRVQNSSNAELVSLTLRDFNNELSIDSPAPGGGSVSALSGALAASLASMVAHLTVGKKGFADVRDEMIELPVKAQELKDKLLTAIDSDTNAFNDIMSAFKLPKATDEQKKLRDAAIETATQKATQIPFDVMLLSLQAMELCKITAEKGNQNSLSDSGVGALQALTAMEGAAMNVLINLKDITDKVFKSKMEKEVAVYLEKGRTLKKLISDQIWEKLSN